MLKPKQKVPSRNGHTHTRTHAHAHTQTDVGVAVVCVFFHPVSFVYYNVTTLCAHTHTHTQERVYVWESVGSPQLTEALLLKLQLPTCITGLRRPR